jgi:hypothetical protein
MPSALAAPLFSTSSKRLAWMTSRSAELARRLSAERRRSIPAGRAGGNASSGRPAVPYYMAAVERCSNPFDKGALAMALHIAYTAGALIAVAAVMEGAPLRVAYALKGSATCLLVDQITEFCRACEIGPFADSDDPDLYAPAAFHDVDWAVLAEQVGEPLDIEGWRKAMRERDAAGLW